MFNPDSSVESTRRRRLTGFAGSLVVLGASVALAFAQRAPAAETAVFAMGDDGYHTYRIPAIVRAANGDLLAFAEGRKNGDGDAGDIDLVLKRSTDGGATWGPMSVIQDEWDDPTGDVAYGNPTPVVDNLDPNRPGRIWLLLTRNNRRVFATCSDDHGAHWSPRRDVTATAKNNAWGWIATGPGHALQLTHGDRAGRLLVAADHRAKDRPAWGAHVIYSDDHGKNWRLGAVDTRDADEPIHPNENLAVQLADGRVYFNARDQHGSNPATRAVAYSSDGGQSYDAPFAPAPQFVTPVVQNSVLTAPTRLDESKQEVILWCGPSDPRRRQDLALMVSTDGAQTWRRTVVVQKGPAAYSDLAPMDDRRIGILYEAGPRDDSKILFQALGFSEVVGDE